MHKHEFEPSPENDIRCEVCKSIYGMIAYPQDNQHVMTLDQYWKFTETTAVYPKEREAEYLRLGLISEVGEVAGILKRRVRDGVTDDKEHMLKEISDVVWYAVRIAKLDGEHLPYLEQYCIQLKVSEERLSLDGILDHILDQNTISTWRYIGILIRREGFTLDHVLQANVDKLSKRKAAGTIQGKGDER